MERSSKSRRAGGSWRADWGSNVDEEYDDMSNGTMDSDDCFLFDDDDGEGVGVGRDLRGRK